MPAAIADIVVATPVDMDMAGTGTADTDTG
jgi:hypothetical protein